MLEPGDDARRAKVGEQAKRRAQAEQAVTASVAGGSGSP
jgi:hypothetical protein